MYAVLARFYMIPSTNGIVILTYDIPIRDTYIGERQWMDMNSCHTPPI